MGIFRTWLENSEEDSWIIFKKILENDSELRAGYGPNIQNRPIYADAYEYITSDVVGANFLRNKKQHITIDENGLIQKAEFYYIDIMRCNDDIIERSRQIYNSPVILINWRVWRKFGKFNIEVTIYPRGTNYLTLSTSEKIPFPDLTKYLVDNYTRTLPNYRELQNLILCMKNTHFEEVIPR